MNFAVPYAQLGSGDASSIEKKARSIADSVLKSAAFRFVDDQTGTIYNSTSAAPANARLKPESRFNEWRYWNGVLNIAMLRLAEVLHDTSYSNFSVRNIAFDFDNSEYFRSRYKGESKWAYPLGQKIVMTELDDYGAMGASLIDVYRLDPRPQYLAYLESAADYITHHQTRLLDGTFARTFPRHWTVWADDLYMSVPFLVRLGQLTGDNRYYDDAAHQVINFNKYLFNEEMGLMYHCWFSDSGSNGVAFWGRANGWMLMAQVDLLDRLPSDHPMRDTLLSLLRREIRGLVHYQDPNGLWHQLLDWSDSYPETSSSAMFTFALARSVEMGYIGSQYAIVAKKGWSGVSSMIRSDGNIDGICAGTGIGDDLRFYYERPTPLNDIHGIGAVLIAADAIMKIMK